MTPDESLGSAWSEACKRIGYTPTPPRPATLLVDGQVFSNGIVHHRKGEPTGSFQPLDGKIQDTPIAQAKLTLADTRETIAATDISPCHISATGEFHFHFRTVQE